MGEILGKLFTDPLEAEAATKFAMPDDGFGFFQVLFHALVYGFILFNASGMISEGSELLLLTPARGLVGSVVLPILGAVPDGAIILFSGASQEQLAVGVGALAGSTVMLLTVPWFLAVFYGRVACDSSGVPTYSHKQFSGQSFSQQLSGTGAAVDGSIRKAGLMMIGTAVTYLIVQIPAFMNGCGVQDCGCTKGDSACIAEKGAEARPYAVIGLVMSIICFMIYLVLQYLGLEDEDKKAVRRRCEVLLKAMKKNEAGAGMALLQSIGAQSSGDGEETALLGPYTADFKYCTTHIFKKYNTNKSKQRQASGECEQVIDREEIGMMMGDLHFSPSLKSKLKAEAGKDGLTLGELQKFTWEWATTERKEKGPASPVEVEEEDEEEEEMPEDIAELKQEDQQAAIWKRSLAKMGLGTLVVLIVSDAMCDVLSAIGARTGISPFYIAFVFAPLASNASELLAAKSYAEKKTKTTMTISLSSLLGAACMNNTFCLGIFLFQIYSNSLIWEFSAETISILVCEAVMLIFAMQSVQKLWYAFIIASLFPLSAALVYVLEGPFGLD